MYTFTNSFKDIMNIVDSLSKEELLSICNGEFKNSPYVRYRECILYESDPAGFLEVYKLPGEIYEFIVLAIKKEYRRKGLSYELIKRMFKYYESIEHGPFLWRTGKNNHISKQLAMKYNFKLINTTGDKNEYVL